MGGERGNIGQTKIISSKREKEREQLLEPKESVSALKIREGTVCPREKAHKSGREKREEDGKE